MKLPDLKLYLKVGASTGPPKLEFCTSGCHANRTRSCSKSILVQLQNVCLSFRISVVEQFAGYIGVTAIYCLTRGNPDRRRSSFFAAFTAAMSRWMSSLVTLSLVTKLVTSTLPNRLPNFSVAFQWHQAANEPVRLRYAAQIHAKQGNGIALPVGQSPGYQNCHVLYWMEHCSWNHVGGEHNVGSLQ